MALTLLMSDIEELVYNWLLKRGIRFEFQSQLIGGFGTTELGDATVDFLLENNIVFRVQGEYWHTQRKTKAKDDLQRERLIALGYTVIDLWEDDLKTRLEYVMQQAMRGLEVG